MVAHIIFKIIAFGQNCVIDKFNKNKKKAKDRLSTLKLIYVQKFAQTRNLIFGNIRFSKDYSVRRIYESLPCQNRAIGRICPAHRGVEPD